MAFNTKPKAARRKMESQSELRLESILHKRIVTLTENKSTVASRKIYFRMPLNVGAIVLGKQHEHTTGSIVELRSLEH